MQYVAAMMGLFGRATQRLCDKLDEAAAGKLDVEMESLFSRLTLDVIGKAVFNYEFDSLTNDTGIVEVSLFNFPTGANHLVFDNWNQLVRIAVLNTVSFTTLLTWPL